MSNCLEIAVFACAFGAADDESPKNKMANELILELINLLMSLWPAFWKKKLNGKCYKVVLNANLLTRNMCLKALDVCGHHNPSGQEVFTILGRAQQSRDGLMESCTCRRGGHCPQWQIEEGHLSKKFTNRTMLSTGTYI